MQHPKSGVHVEESWRRKDYLLVPTQFFQTIYSHFSTLSDISFYSNNTGIVDEVLQLVLEDDLHTYKLNHVFVKNIEENTHTWKVKKLDFEMIFNQVRLRSSFRLTALTISQLRPAGVLSYLGFVSGEKISNAVQSLTSISLQRIANMLSDERCWAHLIAFNGGSNHGDSFIDVDAFYSPGRKLRMYICWQYPSKWNISVKIFLIVLFSYYWQCLVTVGWIMC